MDLTFKDHKHAHNLYTQYNFAFAPKVKFLYHIDFSVNQATPPEEQVPYVQAANTNAFSRVISVLGKSVDLPSYRVSVDTKQQYNRKKNVQTRIDYDEVRMVFHDDNLGITRSMLEEYYNHYFRDGLNKSAVTGTATGYGPRDKYANVVPRYGLDNGSEVPFFNHIKIFQLSKQKWFGYTLINPIFTSWQHDTLEYGDGAGIMENTVSIAYEGVIYTHGPIDDRSLPGDPTNTTGGPQ